MDQQNSPLMGQQFSADNVPSNNPKSSVKNILIIFLLFIVVALGVYTFIKLPSSNDVKKEVSTYQQISNEEQTAINTVYAELKNYENTLTPDQASALNLIAMDRSVDASGTSILQYTQALGYKFKTPWGVGSVSQKTKNSEYLKQLEFKNGKKMLISCLVQTPRESFTASDFITDQTLSKEDADQILNFLGPKADSGFDFTNFLLSINTESVKQSISVESARALSKLLILKSLTLLSSKQPFRFTVGNIKGFQFGDYNNPQSTTIQLFPNNNTRCDIMANESNNLTQKDVDIIISTFEAI